MSNSRTYASIIHHLATRLFYCRPKTSIRAADEKSRRRRCVGRSGEVETEWMSKEGRGVAAVRLLFVFQSN